MGQFYSLLWDACGFWSLTNCGCGLQKKKKKKPHPAWVFLRKMPEKQSILFAWPNKNNDKNLAVANKDASSGAEAYMSLSLA